jgi:Peptidase M15
VGGSVSSAPRRRGLGVGDSRRPRLDRSIAQYLEAGGLHHTGEHRPARLPPTRVTVNPNTGVPAAEVGGRAPTPGVTPTSDGGRELGGPPQVSAPPHRSFVGDVLGALDGLTAPILQSGRTVAQTAQAAANLGVEPKARETAAIGGVGAPQPVVAKAIGGALEHLVTGTQAPKIAAPRTPAPEAKTAAALEALTSAQARALLERQGANPAVAKRIASDPQARASLVAATNAGYGNSEKQDPRDPLGEKTLGRVTTAELERAAKEGRLGINGAGVLTTPQARRAVKQLRQAWSGYDKKAVPRLGELPSGGGSTEFAKWFAHYSALDPRIAAGWVLAEGAGESGNTGGEAGLNNWLAAGFPAHKTDFSNAPYFNGSPKRAAKATAEWMEGKIGGEYGYPVSSGIASAFRQFKGKSPEEQARLIASSGWVDGQEALNQGYYDSIVSNAQSVTASGTGSVPSAVADRLQEARDQAHALGISLPSKQQQHVNYVKTFGNQVGRNLKAITKSPGYEDGSSTKPITIRGPHGGTLVREVQGSSGVASVIDVNKDPEIAARLLLLSKKTGKTIYVLSGYRTPQQAVSVGGFADDPHTKGEAFDIGVDGKTIGSANSISEAEYESVGLYRPYGTAHGGSSAEDNHVQLLNDGKPSVGLTEGGAPEGGSVGGAAPVGGPVSTGGIPAAGAGSPAAGQAAVGEGHPVAIGEVPVSEILSPEHQILAPEEEGAIQRIINAKRLR